MGRARALATLAGVLTACAGHAAAPPAVVELQPVAVVATTPLPGLGTPLRDVPSNVQVFDARELSAQRQGNLAQYLEANPASVAANAAQGNPYQPDISFRGFTASPLAGVPQGLSVFQDGVRINEPFGDVVNWDLLPASAIASLQVLPGSNPLFGLNTLGGALSLHTKRGSRFPGGAIEASTGSFGRRTMQIEQGGASGAWDWFFTGHLADDGGWARHNASQVRQLFAQLGRAGERDEWSATVTAADNRLEGTQTLPASWAGDIRDAYTHPDLNRNRLLMLAVTGTHTLDSGAVLGGNAYLRRLHNGNFSSNVNDQYGEPDPASGEIDTVQAFNDRSTVDQASAGLGLQLTWNRALGGRRNQLVVGAGADVGVARYRLDTQPARFDDTRGTQPVGDFAAETDARTRQRTLSAYASDTLAISPRWSATASARHDDARLVIRDAGGADPALDGDHGFRRTNLGFGLSFHPSSEFTAFASYSEGMRAPTAMELTCADPDAPCKLPNSFVADPPLKKVVARTLEAGARGGRGATRWSVAAYRSEVADDIQFVSSGGAANAGYFRNVGRTRRQGIELSWESRWGPLGLALRYSAIDATYRSGFVERSPANSSADADGNIVVDASRRLPGLPRQSLRMRFELQPSESLSLGANLVASGASVLRGDENQLDRHGPLPGWAVWNLDATQRVGRRGEVFLRVSNVFDRRYANFGVLGRNVFANPERRFDPAGAMPEPFLGQGAPRGAWIGLRCTWGA
ncbi:MAG TPA: TonB-dependent receptor [Albitalea sp.]|nr:TonB-dependent receptor [Albitalea sp.]